MPSIWEEVCIVQQNKPFHRSVQKQDTQSSSQYRTGTKPKLGEEIKIDMVNIKSISFNITCSIITAILKTLS